MEECESSMKNNAGHGLNFDLKFVMIIIINNNNDYYHYYK